MQLLWQTYFLLLRFTKKRDTFLANFLYVAALCKKRSTFLAHLFLCFALPKINVFWQTCFLLRFAKKETLFGQTFSFCCAWQKRDTFLANLFPFAALCKRSKKTHGRKIKLAKKSRHGTARVDMPRPGKWHGTAVTARGHPEINMR